MDGTVANSVKLGALVGSDDRAVANSLTFIELQACIRSRC